MTSLDWIPGERLGIYRLGAKLLDLADAKSFLVAVEMRVDGVDIDSYIRSDGLRLEVRHGRVESISSETEFIYRGTNLIGLKLADIEALLSSAADGVDDVYSDQSLIVADFSDLGLQICLHGEIVVSATCY